MVETFWLASRQTTEEKYVFFVVFHFARSLKVNYLISALKSWMGVSKYQKSKWKNEFCLLIFVWNVIILQRKCVFGKKISFDGYIVRKICRNLFRVNNEASSNWMMYFVKLVMHKFATVSTLFLKKSYFRGVIFRIIQEKNVLSPLYVRFDVLVPCVRFIDVLLFGNFVSR